MSVIMKTKNILSFLFIGMVSFFMVACSNSDDDYPNSKKTGAVTKLIPVKIYGGDNGVENIFEYDDNNRLTTIKIYADLDGKRALFSEQKINYNALGQIADVTGRVRTLDGFETFPYSIKYNGLKIEMQGDYKISYIDTDTDGRILSMRQYSMHDNVKSDDYIDLSFEYDAKGNITKKVLKHKSGYYYSDTYSYDDKNGIFSGINTPQWFFITMSITDDMIFSNNYIKRESTYSDGTTNGTSIPVTNNITYTCNSSGFPIKYLKPYTGFCGTPPLPETNFNIEYKMVE